MSLCCSLLSHFDHMPYVHRLCLAISANITSFTKTRKKQHCIVVRGWSSNGHVQHTENLKFGRVVFEIRKRTDIQTRYRGELAKYLPGSLKQAAQSPYRTVATVGLHTAVGRSVDDSWHSPLYSVARSVQS